MAGPRKERTTLRATVRADVSPLMAVAPDASGALGAATAGAVAGRPAAEGVDPAGEEHALFVVEGEREVGAIRAALARETLYMADGHHRYESALGHREVRKQRAGITWSGEEPENFVLMGIVRADDPGLIVGATHRLLHATLPRPTRQRGCGRRSRWRRWDRATTPAALMARVAAAPPERAPIGVHGLTDDDLLLLAADRTRAALPPDLPASWAGLGPAVLQHSALGPVFGVDEAALHAGASGVVRARGRGGVRGRRGGDCAGGLPGAGAVAGADIRGGRRGRPDAAEEHLLRAQAADRARAVPLRRRRR